MLARFYTLVLILFGMLGCSSPTWAEGVGGVCQERQGELVCGVGQVDHLKYLGDAVLDGTTVTGTTQIVGDLDARHANLADVNVVGDLKANETSFSGDVLIKGDGELTKTHFQRNTRIVGDAKIVESTFNGTSSIIGDVNCSTCVFAQPLTLAANHAYFSQSNTKSINFDPSDKNQYLTITLNTTIDGDVKFASQQGTLYLSKGSLLTGLVKGGVIIRQ